MYKSLLLIIIIVIHSCTSNKSEQFTFGNSVLVQIDNQLILKNEFIQRAEYVLRPDYCSKGNNVHKQIILNSLIAEKLLAIEGESLFDLHTISNFLNGLKTQNMREKLFFAKSQSNELSGEELDNYLKTAERTYHLSFITLPRNVVGDTLLNINNSAEFINRCNTQPHNIYFEFLSETGILIFIPFVLLNLILTYKLIFIWFAQKKFNDLNLLIFCSFTVLFFPIQTTGAFFSTWNGFFYWLIYSFVAYALRKKV